MSAARIALSASRARALVVLALAAGSAWAQEAAITVRQVQFISQAEVPADAPNEARSIMFNKGFTIGYLVEGVNIIGVKKKSLQIAHLLLPDGGDLAQTRAGEPNFAMGSFPAVADSGRFAWFTVECPTIIFGKADRVHVDGSVVVLTGSKLETLATRPHKAGSGDQETIGGWTVTFGVPKGGLQMGDDEDKKAQITLKGPFSALAKLSLDVAGKSYKERGWMGDEDQKTYDFDAPADAPSAVLTIHTWGDLKEATVPLGN